MDHSRAHKRKWKEGSSWTEQKTKASLRKLGELQGHDHFLTENKGQGRSTVRPTLKGLGRERNRERRCKFGQGGRLLQATVRNLLGLGVGSVIEKLEPNGKENTQELEGLTP